MDLMWSDIRVPVSPKSCTSFVLLSLDCTWFVSGTNEGQIGYKSGTKGQMSSHKILQRQHSSLEKAWVHMKCSNAFGDFRLSRICPFVLHLSLRDIWRTNFSLKCPRGTFGDIARYSNVTFTWNLDLTGFSQNIKPVIQDPPEGHLPTMKQIVDAIDASH